MEVLPTSNFTKIDLGRKSFLGLPKNVRQEVYKQYFGGDKKKVQRAQGREVLSTTNILTASNAVNEGGYWSFLR